MVDPVLLGATNHTFERKNIIKALEIRPGIDPYGNFRISNCDLKSNNTINSEILSAIKNIKTNPEQKP